MVKKRIKKSSITTEQRQEWLRRYEAGESPPQIAKSAKVDVRTVRRHIEEARQEREVKEARLTVLRNALEQHYADLVELARELDSRIGAEERVSALSKESRMWQALRQHIPRSPLWSYLNKWHELQDELDKMEEKLYKRLKEGTESDPRLKGLTPSIIEGIADGVARALVFQAKSLARGWKVLDIEKDFVAERAGEGLFDMRYGAMHIGKGTEGQLEPIREIMKDMESEVVTWEEYSDLKRLFQELERLKGDLRDELAVIILRRIVPGRCIYCPI